MPKPPKSCAQCGTPISSRGTICRGCARVRGTFTAASAKAAVKAREVHRAELERLAALAREAGLE